MNEIACGWCGKLMDSDDMVSGWDWSYCSEECKREEIRECEICGKELWINDLDYPVEKNGKFYCNCWRGKRDDFETCYDLAD